MSVSIAGVTVEHETAKAVLCAHKDWEGKKWIPKSVIDDDSEVYDSKDGRAGILIISDWFAEKNGLA